VTLIRVGEGEKLVGLEPIPELDEEELPEEGGDDNAPESAAEQQPAGDGDAPAADENE